MCHLYEKFSSSVCKSLFCHIIHLYFSNILIIYFLQASGQVVPKLFLCPNNLLFFGKSDELLSSRKFGQPPSLMLDSRNDDIAIVNKSNHLFMVIGIEAGQSSNILRQKEIENGRK